MKLTRLEVIIIPTEMIDGSTENVASIIRRSKSIILTVNQLCSPLIQFCSR